MERDEKKIEAFIDKLLSNEVLEQPSFDFTDKVMSKVESIPSVTVYKPLITKSVWTFLILGFVLLVGYVILKEPSGNNSWIDRLNLSSVSNPLENIAFNFSKTLTYAMVLLTIMLGIQIPLLKHYFNKRMAY
ncbi:hypothetical protein [uncultured Winogradskyella sp.]|uniref:hypothetical protein n=1 Tax=uncultured Winogradskyella sp. TaxID=395353 RepID=UPI0030D8872E|tara:strand:- start:268 stop:663 length:396 start_codon:yes stop_codon:yes gene_type:complete